MLAWALTFHLPRCFISFVLQRLYLGRLGDVLRKRQDIASQLQPSLATFDGGRKSVVEYCKVPTTALCRQTA
jgi:hypothetical protein